MNSNKLFLATRRAATQQKLVLSNFNVNISLLWLKSYIIVIDLCTSEMCWRSRPRSWRRRAWTRWTPWTPISAVQEIEHSVPNANSGRDRVLAAKERHFQWEDSSVDCWSLGSRSWRCTQQRQAQQVLCILLVPQLLIVRITRNYNRNTACRTS